MMGIRNIDIEKVAKAVELDAGRLLPSLRDSMAQAKFAAAHTPEMLTSGHNYYLLFMQNLISNLCNVVKSKLQDLPEFLDSAASVLRTRPRSGALRAK